MAEALISAVVEGLTSMAIEGIKEEVSLIKNVKKNVTKLKVNLETIQAFLEDAEKRQLSDLSVKNWLHKLKDVSFEMQDVLDEWNNVDLRSKIAPEASEDTVIDRHKKACFSVPSLFSCCAGPAARTKQLRVRRDIAHKIKDLDARLDAIGTEKDRFGLSEKAVEKHLERPRTTSFIDETEIEGRDEEHHVLVCKLLWEDASDRGQKLGVIPVMGMGGVGKTTLAQLAFNDDTVKAHFDERIWVCVSDDFDEMKISTAIIESINPNAPNVKEVESSFQRLVDCVKGKRFLLVLDDVWTKDKFKWDNLKRPLTCGAPGSRVVVTTRKEEVAIMMEGASNIIKLEMLSKENCWRIFRRLAFSERKEDDVRELEDIGREIANKCKGLPLVARMLGSLMRFKKTKAQWEKVVHDEWWQSKDVEEIFTPYLVSYYDLSSKEKRCFSYCSIFPKDHLICRDKLIGLWMSQNYLSRDSSSEDEGRECFDNLVMRSFFQNFVLGIDGSITHCKMHDIVHDFAQFLTGNECIAVEVGDSRSEMLNPPDEKARHLTLVMSSGAEFPTINYSDMSKQKVWTLYVTLHTRKRLADCSLFLHLPRLRSLCLSMCLVGKLPDSIGRLIHLRYLDISYNHRLVELPDALCNLCNLQTLNLIDCRRLKKLPEGIGKLVSLRHLYIFNCNKIQEFPKGIGKLKQLRCLDVLLIAENSEAALNLGELKRLTNLRLSQSLLIRGCINLRSRDEAEKVDLKSISGDVAHLCLDFKRSRNNQITDTYEDANEILEGLEPHHHNLARLTVKSFKGVRLSPRWITSLINLRKVELEKCNNCEVLPCLGNLPSLVSICITNMTSLKEVGDEFVGASERENNRLRSSAKVFFPKLKYLEFSNMERWERWEGRVSDETTIVMPCLTYLKFRRCPKLVALPEFLVSSALKQVNACGCAEWWDSKAGSEWDKISHAQNIDVSEYSLFDAFFSHVSDSEDDFPSTTP